MSIVYATEVMDYVNVVYTRIFHFRVYFLAALDFIDSAKPMFSFQTWMFEKEEKKRICVLCRFFENVLHNFLSEAPDFVFPPYNIFFSKMIHGGL